MNFENKSNEFEVFHTQLKEALGALGIKALSDAQADQLYRYHLLLYKTNEEMNLTAVPEGDAVPLHYVDSLLASSFLPNKGQVLDVGTGAGLPLIPLAIARPDLTFVGLDSTEKKVSFVRKTIKDLGLENVQVWYGRAEELANQYRESFDAVMARAVANLYTLSELCIPFLKIGCDFIALKGSLADKELTASLNHIMELGCDKPKRNEFELPVRGETQKRVVLSLRKVKSTPAGFPRRFGAIKKAALQIQ
ncbi:MAG: 16S rRNA (guanine(527)-N(7))-methyltransferase RsmG [Clostridia bacterium]|nr:16S rRNA (guanine(527)-N(7))-methyltransferase RsmG [Clostridia bacterium]